jgi:acyl transferase domain-containing protein
MNESKAPAASRQLLRRALDKLEEMEKRLAQAERFRDAALAIVGTACRFPGNANTPEDYWDNLLQGRDAVTTIPPHRFDVEEVFDPDPDAPGKTYCRHGGFLGSVDLFDPGFFGISPRDARQMDPQHRLLLEVTWEALERAGLPSESLAGSPTGVFLGITSMDYTRVLDAAGASALDAYSLTGMPLAFAAGRLSYVFGWQGPAFAVDTACSSSLVALHLACQSLRLGDCDQAIAGGANLLLGAAGLIISSKARVLSPTGRCRTFDARADGIVRSEGCAVVVVKRLSDAIAAGDRVLAIIRGSAINQDGASGGITVPNRAAQEAVVRSALHNGGVHSADVGYVEAHGTGTPLGDPIELRALAAVLGEGRPAQSPLFVGSVKSNIGHTEAAAGVAGLLKTILMLQHGEIPPHLHFETPNPHVAWADTPLRIATERRAWDAPRRIAGVSSFGASGTNAHVILEQPPVEAVVPPPETPRGLLVVSAKTEAALLEQARRWGDWIGEHGDVSLADVTYTAGARRGWHAERLAVLGDDVAQLRSRLLEAAHGRSVVGAMRATASPAAKKVAFVFGGHGGQWLGMGRELLAEEPVFAASIQRCGAALRLHASFDLEEVIVRTDGAWLHEPEVMQPVFWAVQVSLASLWESWGVRPEAVLGHSMGEVAAATVAGLLSLEDGARVICCRSRAVTGVSRRGGMASVELDEAAVAKRLAPYAGRLSVAVVNSANSTVVAGELDALDNLLAELEAEGIFSRRVKIEYASHSPLMDEVLPALEQALAGLTGKPGRVAMYSTVTLTRVHGEELDNRYWVRNLREPVQFGKALESVRLGGCEAFVEVTPHPVLLPAIEAEIRAKGAIVGHSLRRAQPERATLLAAAGALWAQGAAIDATKLWPRAKLVELPTYAWQRQRYWLEPSGEARGSDGPALRGLLGRHVQLAGQPVHVWEAKLGPREVPYLADHCVQGAIVFPAMGYVACVASAMRELAATGTLVLEDVNFAEALVFAAGVSRRVQVSLTVEGEPGQLARFAVFSQPLEGGAWQRHCYGTIRVDAAAVIDALDVAGARARCARQREASAFYEELEANGLEYGPAFARAQELWCSEDEALGRLRGARTPGPLDPALLDAGLHVLAALGPALGSGPAIPVGARRIRIVREPLAGDVWGYVRVTRSGDALDSRIVLADDGGSPLVEIEGLKLAALDDRSQDEQLLGQSWQAQPVGELGSVAGQWLIAGTAPEIAAATTGRLTGAGANAIRGPSAGDVEAWLAALGQLDAERCQGIVFFVEHAAGADVYAAQLEASRSLLALAQAVVRVRWRNGPRLWVVTRGARAVDGDASPVDLAGASVVGLTRSIGLEHPELRATLVDLDADASSTWNGDALVAELGASTREDDVALRAAGRFAGRVVRATLPQADAPSFGGDAAYLLTGGLGGLGLALARWLVEQGARRLVLVARSSPEGAVADALRELESRGAEIATESADISERAQAEAVVQRLTARGWSLRGVVHLAGVVADGMLAQQSAAQLERVMAPKAQGAWNLHLVTRGIPLDFFVLYSSGASLLGAAGQANYAAANAFLDALAHHRRALGLPATSINWGMFGEAGMAVVGDRATRRAAVGFRPLSLEQGHALFARLVASGQPQIGAIPIDVRQLMEAYPQLASSLRLGPLFKGVRRRPAAATTQALRAQIDALPAGERLTRLELLVQEQLALTLGADRIQSDRKTPFKDLGVDSLTGMELRNRLEALTGISLPATLVWTFPTVASLSAHLVEALAAPGAERAGPRARAQPHVQPTPSAGSAMTELPAARATGEPIAIVGIGCRFPGGGTDPSKFWDVLANGVDAIRELDDARWPGDPAARKLGKLWAGLLLDPVETFDHAFFDISRQEAESLDPQQRLALEVAWEALEASGYLPERLAGSRTGVFVGVTSNDYSQRLLTMTSDERDMYAATGNSVAFAAGRISYALGLNGPAITIDTTCSSSLVAVHLACQSLRSGESDVALAGGVNLILSLFGSETGVKLGAHAPDGRCKTFDARANGAVRGEGCGFVVLKPLADAKRQKDRILAVVRGGAVNQDGRSTGLTVPNVLSQEALIRDALANARVAPDQIDYIEAHGTGTSLGDPIELDALTRVIGTPRPDGSRCALASVKTNLGHLEAAAGVAGLIKVVLALQHEEIPEHLHFETLNPRASFDGTPFYVPVKAEPWKRGPRRRIAGISAFGLSGTNAHMIVEEAPPAAPVEIAEGRGLLVLTARTEPARVEQARRWGEWLERHPAVALHDLTYTAGLARGRHVERLALVGSHVDELRAQLLRVASGQPVPGAAIGRASASPRKVAFVFPGQGSQWAGMGRQLMDQEPVFADAIRRCAEAIRAVLDLDLEQTLRGDDAAWLEDTETVQPCIWAVQVSLATLLESWGIHPAAVVGHSLGEIAAACVAGLLRLEDGAKIVCRRSPIAHRASTPGGVAVVDLDEDALRKRLERYEGRLWIAAVNSPRNLLVSGEAVAVEQLVAELQGDGIFSRRVRGDYASHSPLMREVAPALLRALEGIEGQAGRVAMCSTVTADFVEGRDLANHYWVENLCQTVQFAKALHKVIQVGDWVLVEISPHPSVLPVLEPLERASNGRVVSVASLRRDRDSRAVLLESAAKLLVSGVELDSPALFGRGRVLALPTYAWQRERCWIEARPRDTAAAERAPGRHPLLTERIPIAVTPAISLWNVGLQAPWLDAFAVDGAPRLSPGAVLDVVAAAARETWGEGTCVLDELSFGELPAIATRPVQLSLTHGEGNSGHFRLATIESDTASTLGAVVHLSGQVSIEDRSARNGESASIDPQTLRAGSEIAGVAFYEALEQRGCEIASSAQTVRTVWRSAERIACELQVDPDSAVPVALAALDTVFELAASIRGGATLLEPARIRRVRLVDSNALPAFAWVRASDGTAQLVDETGAPLAELDAIALRPRKRAHAEHDGDWFVQAWRRDSLAPVSSDAAGTWIVVGSDAAAPGGIREALVRAGQDVHVVTGDLANGALGVLGAAFDGGRSVRGVVYVADRAASDPVEEAHRESNRLIVLAQAIARLAVRVSPRLWVVTYGADAVPGDDAPPRLGHAPLAGILRSLAIENRELRATRVDVDPEAPAAWQIGEVVRELLAGARDEEVALRAGGRYVSRVRNTRLAAPDLELELRSDAAYLITGGLGALGLGVARWMVERGARRLVLAGRSGAQSDAQRAAISALQASGATVRVERVDVADPAQASRLLSSLDDAGWPLAGIWHAAGVLEDALLEGQTSEGLARVMAPKVRGAWTLHRLTEDRALDFFVLYSSAASLLGSVGQANYAAANAFLDGLAHYRRARGLHALSINWGAFENVVDASDERGAQLARNGARAMTVEQGAAYLESALGSSLPQLGVAAMDVRQWVEFFPHMASSARLSEILQARRIPRRKPGKNGRREALVAARGPARAVLLESVIHEQLAFVIRGDAGEIAADTPFKTLGIDSLRALQLRNRLEQVLDVPLSATLVWTYANVRELAAFLGQTLDELPAEPSAKREAVEPGRSLAAVEPQPRGTEPLAIIGVGCRFPGAEDGPSAFWRLLEDGRDAVRDIGKLRWPSRTFGRTAAQWGGMLASIDRFDPAFFEISPREAVKMDPQQRLALEVAWEALEHAGCVPAELVQSRTGVFLGMASHDYSLRFSRLAPRDRDAFMVTGAAGSIAAGRISYALGLQGPAITLDTACSSSLVSVHLACQSLRLGESDLALAGGVNVLDSADVMESLTLMDAISPDGRCKTFDARANGFVRGEGCGFVVLKRLADAARDRDRILAVIDGSAWNQDGRSSGLTAPSVAAQRALLHDALANARVRPEEIDYVEAHGTGTSLGDPIEMEALKSVIGRERADRSRCGVGSVKTNLGHLEAAAGVAGLIKVVLSLQHGVIPRHLHFETLNPRITLDGTPLYIPTQPVAWKRGRRRRVAGVSAFGFSGTNAHVVVAEAPPRERDDRAAPPPRGLLVVSAKTAGALEAQARGWADWLDAHPGVSLADATYTAGRRRSAHVERLAVVADDVAGLASSLRVAADGAKARGVARGRALRSGRSIAFVFSGQGSQWAGMGRQLLADEPAFAEWVGTCGAAIRSVADIDVEALLRGDDASWQDRADVVQPCLWAIQVALAKLWQSWGVVPAAVVGHSLGEVAAACIAGHLDLEAGASVACARAEVVKPLTGRGGMALVELPEAELRARLEKFAGSLWLAVVNSPRNLLVSGESEALASFLDELQHSGVFCRRVKIQYASHTPLVDDVTPALRGALQGVRAVDGALQMISTVTGASIAGRELTGDYWVRNLREPVQFAAAVQAVKAMGCDVFLEISPHPVLLPGLESDLVAGNAVVGYSLRRGQPERATLLASAGTLWTRGAAVDAARLWPAGALVDLPTYAWQRERHWVEEIARPSLVEEADGAVGAVVPEAPEAPASAGPKPEDVIALRDRLAAAPADERAPLVEAIVRDQASSVLGLDRRRIRGEDSFAALGVDSLLAMELRNRFEQIFEVALSVTAIWSYPTVSDLAAHLAHIAGAADPAATPSIRKLPREPRRLELFDEPVVVFPQSFTQQRTSFLLQSDPLDTSYNDGGAAHIAGPLDTGVLRRAFSEVVARHEVLRTTFATVSGQAVQCVHAARDILFTTEDASASPGSRRSLIRERFLEELRRPFDLTNGPLLRANLLRFDPDDHVLLLTLHHLVADGLSVAPLQNELLALYDAFADGRPSPLAALPFQFGDYAAWESARRDSDEMRQHLAYWKDHLAGVPAILELPADLARPHPRTGAGTSLEWSIDRDLAARLRALGEIEGASLYVTLLSAFDVLLHRFTDAEQLIVGAPVANRAPGTEPLIGFFANTVALRADLRGDPTFRELVRRNKDVVLGALAHQELPFDRIVEELRPERRSGYNPLFQVLFVLQPASHAVTTRDIRVTALETPRDAAIFDFALQLREQEGELVGYFQYATDLFLPETVTQLARCFDVLLAAAVADPDQRVSAIAMTRDD